MPYPLALTLGLIASYLLGAVPFALLAGRAAGVDLRRTGTRNLGAGNLTRVAGLRYGAPAAVADGLKGVVPVLVARRLGLTPEVAAMTGVAAVVGHNWSIYLGGRAGRGLATAAGVLAAVAPLLLIWTTLWAVIGWRIGGGFGGFVGWGFLPGYAMAIGQPLFVVWSAMALAAVIIVRRVQGGIESPQGVRPALARVLWDTDPVPPTFEEVVVS
ncbi:MAG: glycerol-3-phosphate acyltransferase [Acidimicrobiia bacterium]